MADIATKMEPHFYERRQLVEHFGELCIVERGAVGRNGRVLVPWNYWGEDVLLRNKLLLSRKTATTLDFTELLTLSRENLSSCLMDYPEELGWFRRAATCVALVRMACIYSNEVLKADKCGPEHEWISVVFETAQRVAKPAAEDKDRKHHKASDVEGAPLGEHATTQESLTTQLESQVERLESLLSTELSVIKEPDATGRTMPLHVQAIDNAKVSL